MVGYLELKISALPATPLMQPVDFVPTNSARLPDATRLGRVRLQVADLYRSLRYYESVLGFRTIERNDGEATLGAHGDDTPLVVLPPRPRLNCPSLKPESC